MKGSPGSKSPVVLFGWSCSCWSCSCCYLYSSPFFKEEAAQAAGAVEQRTAHRHGRSLLWNADVCALALERRGYQPVPHAEHVGQWVDLLEAMDHGSPSITTTADQMAEELPQELVDDVNRQLTHRGCRYQVHRPLSGRH